MTKLSDKIIKIGEFMYRIYKYDKGEEMEHGNAYTFNSKFGSMTITYPYVFPFQGNFKKHSTDIGIYLKGKDIHVIYPETDKDRKIYSINRIFEITPETIRTELDQYLNEVTQEELKSIGNAFEPEIKETDDAGIKAVRLALIAKEIDFNLYASKFEKSWDRANIRKALEKDTTLTFSKLKQYADLFEFNFGIIIFDKKSARDPMSKLGKALVVYDDDIIEIQDDRIEVMYNTEDVKRLKS
jgi:hypothetical protein